MKVSLAVGGIMLAMILGTPAVRAQGDATSDAALVTGAPVKTILPADALRLAQDNGANILLVDTQQPDDYAQGHVPGAISYPWIDGVTRIKQFPIPLPRGKTLIFYGMPNDTRDLAKNLAPFGYSDVKVMDVRGWYKWVVLKAPQAATAQPTSNQTSTLGKDAGVAAPAK